MVPYQCSAMRGGSDHDCSSLSYRVDSLPSKRNLRDRVLFGIIAAAGLRAAEALGIYVTDLALARDDEHLTVRGKGGTQRLHAPGRSALPLAQRPGQRHPGTGGAGRAPNGRPATSARAVPCRRVGRFRAGAFAAVEQELHEESHRALVELEAPAPG